MSTQNMLFLTEFYK